MNVSEWFNFIAEISYLYVPTSFKIMCVLSYSEIYTGHPDDHFYLTLKMLLVFTQILSSREKDPNKSKTDFKVQSISN